MGILNSAADVSLSGTGSVGLKQTQMQEYTLPFLVDVAANAKPTLSTQEQALLETNRHLLSQATTIIMLMGGKAGRLGECVVGTALLTGALEALRWLNKEGTPIHLLVDADAAD